MTEKSRPVTPESNFRAIARFKKLHTHQVGLKLNLALDADILAKLDSVPSKMGYIKKLIRDDIRKNG